MAVSSTVIIWYDAEYGSSYELTVWAVGDPEEGIEVYADPIWAEFIVTTPVVVFPLANDTTWLYEVDATLVVGWNSTIIFVPDILAPYVPIPLNNGEDVSSILPYSSIETFVPSWTMFNSAVWWLSPSTIRFKTFNDLYEVPTETTVVVVAAGIFTSWLL